MLALSTSPHRPRRHVEVLAPDDRRQLERLGWRTTMDYRENHVRSSSGQLLEAVPVWTAEAERFDDGVRMVSACGPTPDDAWASAYEQVRRGDWTVVVSRLRLRPATG